eukprot:scaffold90254_cov17-Prasinocladus_malaysianus.AAC.1
MQPAGTGMAGSPSMDTLYGSRLVAGSPPAGSQWLDLPGAPCLAPPGMAGSGLGWLPRPPRPGRPDEMRGQRRAHHSTCKLCRTVPVRDSSSFYFVRERSTSTVHSVVATRHTSAA